MRFELNSKEDKDGYRTILAIGEINGKRKGHSTQVKVRKNYFNPKAQYGRWINARDSDHIFKNDLLKTKLSEFENYNPLRHGEISIDKYCTRFLKQKEGNSIGYQNRVKSITKKLITFSKGRLLKDFDVSFLNDYHNSLQKEKLSSTTIAGHFSVVKIIINNAESEGYFNRPNPFRQFKIKAGKSEKTPLSIVQIEKIIATDFKNENVAKAKDIFLLAFYCGGLRIGDVILLGKSNIVGDSLQYIARKTNKKTKVSIQPPAKEIIERNLKISSSDSIWDWQPSSNSDIDIHNFISNRTEWINKYLKTIGDAVGYKGLSSHISRHSFANYAVSNDVDIRTLQTLLQHSSVSITEGYLKDLIFDNQEQTMKKLFG